VVHGGLRNINAFDAYCIYKYRLIWNRK